MLPSILFVFIAVFAGLVAGFALPATAAIALAGVFAVVMAMLEWNTAIFLYFVAALSLASTMEKPAKFAVAPDPSSFAESSRLRAAAEIDSIFGDDASLAKALLVADQSEIPHDRKKAYADAGIVHMLSISGLHVSIIAGSVLLLLQVVGCAPRTASFASAAIIVAYVYVLGFPPPAVRSAVMVTTAAISRACQRHTSRWSVLALGGLVPLASPQTALDIGYQLSVAGMASLIAAGALLQRCGIKKLGHLRSKIVAAATISAVATACTAPLVAASFGRLSLIAPLSNLVADPILAIAQPMLFLALALAPWLPAARFVAAAVHPFLAAFDQVATLAASVPHAAIDVAATPAQELAGAVAAIAGLTACVSRFPARSSVVAVSAVACMVWLR